MKVTFENEEEFLDFVSSFDAGIFYKAAFRMDGSCQLLTFEELEYEDIEDYPVTIELRRNMMQINAVRAMGKIYLCNTFSDVGHVAMELLNRGNVKCPIEALSKVICLTDWYDETRRYVDLFNPDLSDMVKNNYKRQLVQDGYRKVLFGIQR